MGGGGCCCWGHTQITIKSNIEFVDEIIRRRSSAHTIIILIIILVIMMMTSISNSDWGKHYWKRTSREMDRRNMVRFIRSRSSFIGRLRNGQVQLNRGVDI